MKKERLMEFDVLRGIAFIMVVIQHTIGGFSFRKDISFYDLLISRFLYTIATIAVPIFVFLTAISLIYTYYDSFNAKTFYIKKIKFLVIPYIIISYLNVKLSGQVNGVIDFIPNLITGNCKYHLWYMGMIIRIYLYFPLILIFIRKLMKKSMFIKVSFFIFYALGYWIVLKNNNDITNSIGKLLFKNPTELQQKFINITPLIWSLYFVIGAYFILSYTNFKHIILKYKYAIVAIYSMTISYYYYTQVTDVIGNPIPYIKFDHAIYIFHCIVSILFFYVISYYIAYKLIYISKLFKFIGKYSFPAYMIHVIVLEYLVRYMPYPPVLSSPIKLLLITIIAAPTICYLANYLPYSEYLIGVKSKISFKKTNKKVSDLAS